MNIAPYSIAVIANGQLDITADFIKRIQQFKSIYLIDGGANYFFQFAKKFSHPILPKEIIGDLDSIQLEVMEYYKSQNIPFEKLNRDKDKTDLEVAIEKITNSFPEEKITIFGAFGKRIDHTLSNLLLLKKFHNNIFFESLDEITFVIQEGVCNLNLAPGQTLSLIPFFEPCIITTKGLKWEMNEKYLDFAGISNVSLEGKCQVKVIDGKLMCVINNLIDKKMSSNTFD